MTSSGVGIEIVGQASLPSTPPQASMPIPLLFQVAIWGSTRVDRKALLVGGGGGGALQYPRVEAACDRILCPNIPLFPLILIWHLVSTSTSSSLALATFGGSILTGQRLVGRFQPAATLNSPTDHVLYLEVYDSNTHETLPILLGFNTDTLSMLDEVQMSLGGTGISGGEGGSSFPWASDCGGKSLRGIYLVIIRCACLTEDPSRRLPAWKTGKLTSTDVGNLIVRWPVPCQKCRLAHETRRGKPRSGYNESRNRR